MAVPSLRSVSSELPEPPYPAHTKAGSFAFDIDVDRLTSSDTWDLLPSELRPWWIFLLTMSWRQVPCGSFRDDNEIIAAKLGASEEFVQLHRRKLLRGWYRCSDGRLYHPVIVEKVRAFIGQRSRWRGQKNKNLDADSARNPRGSGGSHVSSAASSSSSSSFTSIPDSQDKHGEIGGAEEREVSAQIGPVAETEQKRAGRSRGHVFVIPSVGDVMDYCLERGNDVDSEAFIAFYESNGWKVGKNRMKDWKAAVRTWERRNAKTLRNVTGNESAAERRRRVNAELEARARRHLPEMD